MAGRYHARADAGSMQWVGRSALAPRLARTVHRQLMKRFLLATATATLLLTACFTNPVTGRKELVMISPEQELSLGAQSFADVTKSETVSTDRAAIARVERVGQRIAQAVGSDLPGAAWQFTVFESAEVNAFALPGGKVGVYTGLLALAASDDELAVVLGHEIGHVIARHGAERLSEAQIASGVGALGAALLQTKTADPKMLEMYKLAYGGGVTLARTLPHSRSQESEADHMGVVYAARAGYDPRAAIAFWRKMVDQKSGASSGVLAKLLSDHPADNQRIADLETLMPEVVPVYEQHRQR